MKMVIKLFSSPLRLVSFWFRRRPVRRYCILIGSTAIVCAIYLTLAALTEKIRLFDTEKKVVKTTSTSPISVNETWKATVFNNNWVGFPSMQHVDCRKAISNKTPNRVYPQKVQRIFAADILQDATNCASFVQKYGFGRYPAATQEELEFPLAYSLLFHKDLDQVLFLLRAIYRPHNAYCISIDTKCELRFVMAVRAVAKCLPNVFLATQQENIIYGSFARLKADINCFKDLITHPVKWQYVINTPGQQFPLKTNLEIVQILKLMNGSNDILGKYDPSWWSSMDQVHEYVTNETTGEVSLVKADKRKSPPPHNLVIVKCSAYGMFARAFVNFVLTNQVAQDLLEWCHDTWSPDEFYWATLNHNTVSPAPGGIVGPSNRILWLAAFSIWKDGGMAELCATKFVRLVCIFSTSELPLLVSLPDIFANKFHITHHPAALHCLDQHIFNKTAAVVSINKNRYQMMIRRDKWMYL